jgi:iron(III) transport system ATP-binding protein
VTAPSAVVVSGLRVALGGREVLSGVDLHVPAGTSTVLLGRSGSGKTTLLRTVAGLCEAEAGRIEVGGRVVADPRSRVPAERRGVAMIFQTLELFPHMTVAENLAFGLPGRPRGRRAASHPRVREAAEAVGIEALLGRRPPTLSGGERQRTAIARALAPSPSVLLYDEPLASLDPDRRSELRALVRSLRSVAPATVLHVTHDAEEALEMGDEVAVLDGGRIVDRGPPERVYHRPASAAAARALGAATILPAQVTVRGGSAVLSTPIGQFPIERMNGAGAAIGLACFRPEQVSPGEGGASATVLECVPRAGEWAFSARLESGETVSGRAGERLAAGSVVALAVRGLPAPLPADGTSATKGAA